MVRDKFSHRRHEDDVELEAVETSHPVLTDHTVYCCPHDGCRYRELDMDAFGIDHDVEPGINVDERLDELAADVETPVYQVVHCSGMTDPKKAFQTHDEAAAWVFGNYGGPGNRSSTFDIRKTRTYASGTHSQRARKKDYPMIFAIVNTALDPGDWGHIVRSNLVPRAEDYPDSASWKATPSVVDAFDYHRDPPDHIIESKYGMNDEHTTFPDGYTDALHWHVAQVAEWDVVVQTPELFLDDEEQAIAAEHTDGWDPVERGA